MHISTRTHIMTRIDVLLRWMLYTISLAHTHILIHILLKSCNWKIHTLTHSYRNKHIHRNNFIRILILYTALYTSGNRTKGLGMGLDICISRQTIIAMLSRSILSMHQPAALLSTSSLKKKTRMSKFWTENGIFNLWSMPENVLFLDY